MTQQATGTPEILPPQPPPIKALILDDDQFDRQRLRRMISSLPIPVDADSAATLDELRQKVSVEDYDLVFLDFGLQGGDGLDALTIVNDASRSSDVACIMVTNENRGDVAAACFRGGCRDFIPKSDLSTEKLSNAVATLRPAPPPAHLISAGAETEVSRRIGEILAPALQMALAEALRHVASAENQSVSVFPETALDDEMSFVFRDLADMMPPGSGEPH